MDDYLVNRETYDVHLIYVFGLGQGGIGDYLKFFMWLLCMCIKKKMKLSMLKNGRLQKYLGLRHYCMYTEETGIRSGIDGLKPGTYNISPENLYSAFKYEDIDMPFEEVFTFSPDIRSLEILKPYTSLHLRLGDKFLETPKMYVLCKNDCRVFDESRLVSYISQNSSKTLYFFCDNASYRQKIKSKFPSLQITDFPVGHTSLNSTTEEQIKGAVAEFFIMSFSEEIVAFSNSGFSKSAAMFRRVPLLQF